MVEKWITQRPLEYPQILEVSPLLWKDANILIYYSQRFYNFGTVSDI